MAAFLIIAAAVSALVISALALRVLTVLRNGPEHKPGRKGSASVLLVAGSGGHTTEILRLMGSLSRSYRPRHYVLADTDQMSEEKIRSFEEEKESEFTLHRVPRSREVRQSWSSSLLSSWKALQASVPLLFRLQPDLLLCNGPGTCVPLCVAGVLLGVLGIKRVLIVYVESVCRVETLSLSGKILYNLADYFFVQWAPLKERYPKAVYLGRLV